MRSMYLCVMLSFCLINQSYSQTQYIGTPFIQNYSAQDYKLHPKNFAAIQDNRGIMYFGNSHGVMEFDGSNWTHLPLPDGKSAVSLSKTDQGQITIGSVSEIGEISTNYAGELSYKSFLSMLPDSKRDFGYVWQTECLDDKKIFISYKQLIIISPSKAKVIQPSSQNSIFKFLAQVNKQLYINESVKGLQTLISGNLKLIPHGELFKDENIYGILPHPLGMLIVSSRGLDIYDGKTIRYKKSQISTLIKNKYISTRAIIIDENTFALGTAKSGIVFFNQHGEIQNIVNKQKGLVSNNVTDFFVDNGSNIWVVTNRGLSHIHSGSPFTTMNEVDNLEGMGYAAQIFKDNLYLGTSQGLFVREWKHNDFDREAKFHPIDNVREQIYFLDVLDGVLLCGDNHGLYEIEEGVAKRLSFYPNTGAWTAKKLNDKQLILGTFEGLELYEMINGHWRYKSKLEGFNESSRFLEIDKQNNIWVCHGNKGLYKIGLSKGIDSIESVVNISVNQGFSNDYINHVSKIEGELIFVNYNKIYVYNAATQNLEEHRELNELFKNHKSLTKVVELDNGKIWSINGQHIELFKKNKKERTYKSVSLGLEKLQGQLISDYELLFNYDNDKYFIGVQDGFIHVDGNESFFPSPMETQIRKVELINSDSLLFSGVYINPPSSIKRSFFSPKNKLEAVLPFSQNAIRFTNSTNFFEDHSKNLYSYSITSNTDINPIKWSPWSISNIKEFTYLPEGDYQFVVRSKNVYGKISSSDSFYFRVLPPWYNTIIAYLIYGVLIVLLLLFFWRILKWKLRIQRLKLAKQKKQEFIILRNEKLEADLKFKNAELANLASNLLQKRAFLSQIKVDLSGVKENDLKPTNEKTLIRVIKSVEKNIKFDDSWDHFQTSFDEVYHDFLFKLREDFSFLKPTDLMLCAYVRLQKSNKEIADILNLSELTVKKRKVRLKNKLGIQKSLKLSDFLIAR